MRNLDFILKTLAFILLTSLFAIASSCEKEVEFREENYPKLYSYSTVELGKSSFHEVTQNGFREIEPQGVLVGFDSMVLNILHDTLLFSPFLLEFELLSDSLIRIKSIDYENGIEEEVVTQYLNDGNKVRVLYDGIEVLVLEINEIENQLTVPVWTYIFSYFDDFLQKRKYSHLVSEAGYYENPDPALQEIGNNQLIQLGDTIALNQSFFVYDAKD